MAENKESLLAGFKAFLMRGNVIDLAVAVVIGAAFTNIVNSVVKGIINPVVGAFGTKNLESYSSCLKDPCRVIDGEMQGIQIQWGLVLSAVLSFLITAAVVLTFAEMIHTIASWEISVALAPDDAQGAYLGVHGLAQSTQRFVGPLLMTGLVSAGPLAWPFLGAALVATSAAQNRLVRRRLPEPSLSVAKVTVSEH